MHITSDTAAGIETSSDRENLSDKITGELSRMYTHLLDVSMVYSPQIPGLCELIDEHFWELV